MKRFMWMLIVVAVYSGCSDADYEQVKTKPTQDGTNLTHDRIYWFMPTAPGHYPLWRHYESTGHGYNLRYYIDGKYIGDSKGCLVCHPKITGFSHPVFSYEEHDYNMWKICGDIGVPDNAVSIKK